jgi:hypothetical protein
MMTTKAQDATTTTEFVLTLGGEPIHREPQPPTDDVGAALDEWLEKMRAGVQAYAVTRERKERVSDERQQ